MMTDHCVAITSKGAPCSHRHSLSPEGLCLWHDPARVEELRAARRRGQARSAESQQARRRSEALEAAAAGPSAGPRPDLGDSLESVTQWLRWLGEALVRHEVQVTEAAALTTVARLLLSSLTQRDLEAQLRRLRKDYEALKRRLERAR